MLRSLRNERRAPRVPLRVWATLAHRRQEWRVETEDVGPGGCLVRSDRQLAPGLALKVVLHVGQADETFATEGRVAWFRPPHAGIAFDVRAPEWFSELLASDPRLGRVMGRAPADLDAATTLFLAPPPRIVELSGDEALLVAHAEQGIAVRELLSRAGMGEERGARVLFGLLDKRVFTLCVGEAGEAWKWRAALEQAGHEVPRARTGRERPAGPIVERVSDPSPPTSPHVRRYERAGAPAIMARMLRGVASSQRPPRAETMFLEARGAEAAGRVAEAIALLRRALALAPHDREISAVLARLAFRDPV
jgi:hypothetical protein